MDLLDAGRGPILPAKRPRHRIAGFDGLRALAFLGVFANHKLAIPQGDALGAVGVWTFFALSGFLITGILARSREEVEAERISIGAALRGFYLRRTARIFPVYYATLGVALIGSQFIFVYHFRGWDRLAYFLYATNIAISLRDAWPGDFSHLWSLAIEEQYYILFAPLVLFLPRRRTAVACLAILVIGVMTCLAMHAARAPPIAIYVSSVVNFGMLGFGGLVGLASRTADPPPWLTSTAAQAAVAVCIIAAPLAFGAWRGWMDYGPAVVLLAGLLLFQIFRGQQTGFVALLESAPLRLMGRVSYAAYLFHPFIHFSTLQHLLAVGGVRSQVPRPLGILAELAATMLLCAISWRLLEAPIVRWARPGRERLFRPKPSRYLSETPKQAH
jgi:peptidoglycan/LPS O-acetylase OafA/YrhL